jgi:hypothetical protein
VAQVRSIAGWHGWRVLSLALALMLSPVAATPEQPGGVMPVQYLPNQDATMQPSLSEQMQSLADTLDYVKHGLDIAIPTNPELKSFNDLTGYTQNIFDLANAMHSDLAAHRDPLSNSSQTVAQLGQLELGFATSPDQLGQYATLGLIGETTARRLGYFSFGAGDIAAGLGTMAAPGNLGNVDAVTKVLDGINRTAWGIYGFALTGDWDVAQAYAAAADLTAKGARALTLPVFDQLTAQISGANDKIVAIWEQAQQWRLAQGLSAQSIEDFYHGDATILNQIGAGALAQADARLGVTSVFEQRTVEHYRETCINGNCTRIDLQPPTNTMPDQPLGGVRLDQPLTGAALRGVRLDPDHGAIVLIGDRDFVARGLRPRDLAMALWLVFGPQPQDPAFSLDPDNPHDPGGPWLRARYIPELLQGRSFGAEMFAADLRLKELSFQNRVTAAGKLEEWKSRVPGFESYAALAMKQSGGGGSAQWSRFWIVADRVTARQAGDTVLFDARMAVKARREVPDPASQTGLRDVDTDAASLEARWARLATEHYDQLAAESPVLSRVRELAVAIAVAKTLKQMGAKVDLACVAALVNGDGTYTISRINAFSVNWRTRAETPFRDGNRSGVRIETHELRLFGGVDLTVVPQRLADDGSASGIDKAVRAGFDRAPGGTHIVRFEHSGSRLEAVALPLLIKQ